jgi:DNA-directed RNA polymerase I subunit RPA49
MEPRARSLSYAAASAGGPAGDADAAAAAALRRERNAALVEQFGSQRRRKQLAAAKSAQVEAGQVSGGGAVLGMIASAGAGAATKDALIAASLAQRNLPPHHLDALTAEEAYRQDEIVPGAVAGALETANLFLAQERPEYRAELAAEGTFGGGYVLSRLAALAAPEAGVRQARARCLAFLGHLLKLLRQRGSGLRVKEGEGLAELAARLKMAPGVLDGVLDAFYVAEPGDEEGGGGGGGRRWSLPKERRELMLAWALVLAVRAEAQSTLEADAFRALVAELCMRPADVVARLREAGCTCLAMSAAGLAGGGARGSAFRVCLMPPTPEPTPFGARFPRLKMGARKPGAR